MGGRERSGANEGGRAAVAADAGWRARRYCGAARREVVACPTVRVL